MEVVLHSPRSPCIILSETDALSHLEQTKLGCHGRCVASGCFIYTELSGPGPIASMIVTTVLIRIVI